MSTKVRQDSDGWSKLSEVAELRDVCVGLLYPHMIVCSQASYTVNRVRQPLSIVQLAQQLRTDTNLPSFFLKEKLRWSCRFSILEENFLITSLMLTRTDMSSERWCEQQSAVAIER